MVQKPMINFNRKVSGRWNDVKKKSDFLAKLGLILIQAEIRQQKKSSLTQEWTPKPNIPKSGGGKITQMEHRGI